MSEISRSRKLYAAFEAGDARTLLEMFIRFGVFLFHFGLATVTFIALTVLGSYLGFYGANPGAVCAIGISALNALAIAYGEWTAFYRSNSKSQACLGIIYGLVGVLLLIAITTRLKDVSELLGMNGPNQPTLIVLVSIPVIVYLIICGLLYIMCDGPLSTRQDRKHEVEPTT